MFTANIKPQQAACGSLAKPSSACVEKQVGRKEGGRMRHVFLSIHSIRADSIKIARGTKGAIGFYFQRNYLH